MGALSSKRSKRLTALRGSTSSCARALGMHPSRAAVAELFWHFSNKSPDGWFGHVLGLRLPRFGGTLDIRHVRAQSSEIASTVPAWLCGQVRKE